MAKDLSIVKANGNEYIIKDAALNELVGDTPLLTEAQTITEAINERHTQLQEFKEFIGEPPLDTEAQTLSGAINELAAKDAQQDTAINELTEKQEGFEETLDTFEERQTTFDDRQDLFGIKQKEFEELLKLFKIKLNQIIATGGIDPGTITPGTGDTGPTMEEILAELNLPTIWYGTQAQWNALTAREKSKYDLVFFTDAGYYYYGETTNGLSDLSAFVDRIAAAVERASSVTYNYDSDTENYTLQFDPITI